MERKGETNFFTSQMIKDCMKKVVACNLHQVVKVDDELEIKAYYAGKCKHIHLFSESILREHSYMTSDVFWEFLTYLPSSDTLLHKLI